MGESGLDPEELIVGHNAIAAAMHMSRSSLQRRLSRACITLPRLGKGGKAPSYVPRAQFSVLKTLLTASTFRKQRAK